MRAITTEQRRGKWLTGSTCDAGSCSVPTGAGFWSFWIFLMLFVASLFAEFIANDRPILAYYKGELLFPVFVDYPEEKFGGFLRRHRFPRCHDPAGDREPMAGWSGRPSATPTTPSITTCPRRPPRRRLQPDARRGLRQISERRQRPELRLRQYELARHRRSGPRRHCPAHLWLPHFGAVRPYPHHRCPRSSASLPAPCRAISAAGSTSSSSGSSRSGPRSRPSIC